VWAVDRFSDDRLVAMGTYQRDFLELISLNSRERSIDLPVCYGSSHQDGNDQRGEACDGDDAQNVRGNGG